MILLLLIVPPLLHNYFFSDDHTRVRLRSKADEDKDDYLNANFVDGFRQPRAYIATQGPIQGTFPAFWKMVWEQNTQVIVMITHLFENGKVCCCKEESSRNMFKYCRKTTFTPHIIMSFSWHMIEVFALLLFFFFSQNVTFIGQILEQRLTETCLSACCVKISLLLTHYGLLVSDTWNLMYPQWVPFSFGKDWKNYFFQKRIIFQMFFLHSVIYFSFHFFSICRALWKRKWLP